MSIRKRLQQGASQSALLAKAADEETEETEGKPAETHTLSVPEAGRRYFGLSRNGSYAAADRGDIPTISIGKLRRVPIKVLERWLDAAPLIRRPRAASPGAFIVTGRVRAAGLPQVRKVRLLFPAAAA